MTLEHCLVARAVFRWALIHHLMSRREHTHRMRAILATERSLVACQGKAAFVTFGLANKIARRGHREERMVAYRCWTCGSYHVGHANPGLRRARRHQRIRMLEEADA